MQRKTLFLGAALGGVTFIEVRKRLHQRNANWLRNDQGVGPAHQRGTHRGEDRVRKRGHEGDMTVAGRIPADGVGPAN